MLMHPTPLPIIAPERRFSRKIILGRLNRILPKFAKKLILLVRYATFPQRCSRNAPSTYTYTDGSWVNRKVTKDQEAIERYLATQSLEGKRILHAGVGSSSIAKKFGSIASVDGLTIMEEERVHAEDLSLPLYRIFLMDKYGPDLSRLPGGYNYIVDNDLAGYAPCKDAFERMLETYIGLLAPDGLLVTGILGLSYFDNGFPIPDFYMRRLSRRMGFRIKRADAFLILLPEKLR